MFISKISLVNWTICACKYAIKHKFWYLCLFHVLFIRMHVSGICYWLSSRTTTNVIRLTTQLLLCANNSKRLLKKKSVPCRCPTSNKFQMELDRKHILIPIRLTGLGEYKTSMEYPCQISVINQYIGKFDKNIQIPFKHWDLAFIYISIVGSIFLESQRPRIFYKTFVSIAWISS